MSFFQKFTSLWVALLLPFLLTNNFLYRFRLSNMIFFTIGLTFALLRVGLWAKMLYAALKPPKDLATRYGKGSWVLVTGASDGIGKAFIDDFASKGFNIVLLSRNKEKLEKVESQLKSKYPNIQTRIVVRDLTKSEEDRFGEEILEEVKDLDISVVVNNAGKFAMTPYLEQSTKDIRDMIIMNCLGLALITRVFIPKIQERKQKSALINISSLAAVNPMPDHQLYAATKSFVDFLTRGLHYEHPNLDILTVKPALVKTQMADGRKTDFYTVEPEECVKGVLNALGTVRETHGDWRHCHKGWITRNLPPFIKDKIAQEMGRS